MHARPIQKAPAEVTVLDHSAVVGEMRSPECRSSLLKCNMA